MLLIDGLPGLWIPAHGHGLRGHQRRSRNDECHGAEQHWFQVHVSIPFLHGPHVGAVYVPATARSTRAHGSLGVPFCGSVEVGRGERGATSVNSVPFKGLRGMIKPWKVPVASMASPLLLW